MELTEFYQRNKELILTDPLAHSCYSMLRLNADPYKVIEDLLNMNKELNDKLTAINSTILNYFN